MSGLELLPKARAMRPDVPVILITAYGDAETKRKALENGAETLLTKPHRLRFVARDNRDECRTGGVTAPPALSLHRLPPAPTPEAQLPTPATRRLLTTLTVA